MGKCWENSGGKSGDVWEEYRKSTEMDAGKKPEAPAAKPVVSNGRASGKKERNMVRVCPDCGEEFSVKTKFCPTCSTRLLDPLSNGKAEMLSYEIRSQNGSEEDGVSSTMIRSRLKTGAILSVLALIASVVISGMHVVSMMRYYGEGILTGGNLAFVRFLGFLNTMLLANIVVCSARKTADTVRYLMHQARTESGIFASQKYSKDVRHSGEENQQFVLMWTCGFSIALPIISLIISAFELMYFLHSFLHVI